MTQLRSGSALRSSARRALIVMAALTVTGIPALAGQPPPPLPCSAPPQVAALSFFEFVESPYGEENIRRDGPRILSRQLIQSTSPQDIINIVRSARQQYSFDKYEMPLSSRLAGEPQLLNPGQEGFNPRAQVSVRIWALSSRGRVEQRVSLVCEESVWKVVSFSYGPAGR